MKTILVTGAAGYIGRHVVKNALDRGYKVIAADFNFKGVDERAEFCDVPLFSGDADLYRKLGSPDICIHLAWRDGFRHNSPAHMKDLSSHIVFLNTLIDGGLKGLSIMGTMHEVGYWEGAINESTPCKPSGQNKYDFIDLDELATMIVAASVQDEINGIINVCTGKPMSLAERVEQFLKDKNYKIRLNYGAFPDRPYDSPGTWGDPAKINKILSMDTYKKA